MKKDTTYPVIRHHATVQDAVAIEEPLEIKVAYPEDGGMKTEPLLVTMRTPGNDRDLAMGILYAEGIIHHPDDVVRVEETGEKQGAHGLYNTLKVTLKDSRRFTHAKVQRNFVVHSSCGVCGKSSMDAIEALHAPEINRQLPRIQASLIPKLPDKIARHQAQFTRTGGTHASALLDSFGNIVHVAEDVGRHNALDKLIGHSKAQIDSAQHFILCSGRVGFDLMQKVIMANVGMMVGIGAPTSLAIELAKRFDISLIGFIKQHNYNIYHGSWRVQPFSQGSNV